MTASYTAVAMADLAGANPRLRKLYVAPTCAADRRDPCAGLAAIAGTAHSRAPGVVERGQAVFILGVDVDAQLHERGHHVLVAGAYGIVQRRAAARALQEMPLGDEAHIRAGLGQQFDQRDGRVFAWASAFTATGPCAAIAAFRTGCGAPRAGLTVKNARDPPRGLSGCRRRSPDSDSRRAPATAERLDVRRRASRKERREPRTRPRSGLAR